MVLQLSQPRLWRLLAQPLASHLPCTALHCRTADVHQLQAWYSLPLELARAIQAVGVNAVVAEHLLPQASCLCGCHRCCGCHR